MSLPASLPITETEWNNTPPAVQALVLALWTEVSALREQVGRNSQNSSRPPSSDPPGMRSKKRTPSGRKQGGQPGHEGASRKLRPVSEVKEVIPVKPEKCQQCGHHLSGEDSAPRRHQVTEIPRMVAETTEYQLHMLECPECGAHTSADLPAGVPSGAFGPRVQAIVAVLSGQYHLSKRQIEELLWDFFGVDMSLGSVAALEQATSATLEGPVAEAQAAVKEQPVANVDETGFKEGNRRAWLWVAVTGVVTVFLLRLSRGAKVAKELLGEAYQGVVGSDRWSGYNWVENTRRQVCWAHLLRGFEAFLARGGASERIGRLLLSEAEQMFHWWHRVRDGTLSRSEFQAKMGTVQARVGELLREGTTCENPKTAHTCQNLLEVEEALWAFVRLEGVEPTNNAAERAIRAGVLWRKGSFGTQGVPGSLFVERMMTVVASLRQQKRNVLAYLQAACEAALRGEKTPSLLPSGVTAINQPPV